MTKHTILFLAANPLGTDRLALDEEARAIRVALERSGHRDKFELVTRWAVRPMDLLDELRKVKPTVVHFSGHGGQGELQIAPGPCRDAVGQAGTIHSGAQHGLFFQGPDGRPQIVSSNALKQTFAAAGTSVKLVVLNSCYSHMQAKAILAHVDCVIGMGSSIRDDAARSFVVGFYGGLGERQSVEAAYKQGCAAIGLEGTPDDGQPKLKARRHPNARAMVLVDIAPAQPQDSGARQTNTDVKVPEVEGRHFKRSQYLAPILAVSLTLIAITLVDSLNDVAESGSTFGDAWGVHSRSNIILCMKWSFLALWLGLPLTKEYRRFVEWYEHVDGNSRDDQTLAEALKLIAAEFFWVNIVFMGFVAFSISLFTVRRFDSELLVQWFDFWWKYCLLGPWVLRRFVPEWIKYTIEILGLPFTLVTRLIAWAESKHDGKAR